METDMWTGLTGICICAAVAYFLSTQVWRTICKNGFIKGLGLIVGTIVSTLAGVVGIILFSPTFSQWIIVAQFKAMGWHPLGGVVVAIICNLIVVAVVAYSLFWIAEQIKSPLIQKTIIGLAVFAGSYLSIEALGLAVSYADLWGWALVLTALIGTTAAIKAFPGWWDKKGRDIVGVPAWYLINHVAVLYIALSRGWDYYADIKATAYTACAFLVINGLLAWYTLFLSNPNKKFWRRPGAIIQAVVVSPIIWFFLLQTVFLQFMGQLTTYSFELSRETTVEARKLERMEREANAKLAVSAGDQVYWVVYWDHVSKNDATKPVTWTKAAIEGQRAKVAVLKAGIATDDTIPDTDRVKSKGEREMDREIAEIINYLKSLNPFGNRNRGSYRPPGDDAMPLDIVGHIYSVEPGPGQKSGYYNSGDLRINFSSSTDHPDPDKSKLIYTLEYLNGTIVVMDNSNKKFPDTAKGPFRIIMGPYNVKVYMTPFRDRNV